jgi:ribulose-phosphate 3-epimerase
MRSKSGWLADLPAHRLIAEMSLWSANLVDLSGEIARVEDMTDIFHIDVADGHFSPAMLYFPDLVASVRMAPPPGGYLPTIVPTISSPAATAESR